MVAAACVWSEIDKQGSVHNTFVEMLATMKVPLFLKKLEILLTGYYF